MKYALILLFVLTAMAHAAEPETGTIRGRAVIGIDRDPGAAVRVEIWRNDFRTVADKDGRFQIKRVPPGTYEVWLIHPGIGSERTVRASVRAGHELDLGDIALASYWFALGTGTKTSARGEDFETAIRPVKAFHVGDKPSFQVSIRNLAPTPVLLVRPAEASDRGLSPQVTIQIEGPPGGFESPPAILFCGTGVRRVTADHFVEIGPGDSFDPFSSGWRAFEAPGLRFNKPGRYLATFRYATIDSNPNAWIEGPWSPTRSPEWFRALIKRVPAVELLATTTFDVAP